jgi:hypothetical protein
MWNDIRRWFWSLALVACMNCGDSTPMNALDASDDTDAADSSVAAVSNPQADCTRLIGAGCGALAACKAYIVPSDHTLGTFTMASCQDAISAAVRGCIDSYATQLMATSRAQLDACVAGLSSTPCAQLCGHVPTNPAACSALGWPASTAKVECAP